MPSLRRWLRSSQPVGAGEYTSCFFQGRREAVFPKPIGLEKLHAPKRMLPHLGPYRPIPYRAKFRQILSHDAMDQPPGKSPKPILFQRPSRYLLGLRTRSPRKRSKGHTMSCTKYYLTLSAFTFSLCAVHYIVYSGYPYSFSVPESRWKRWVRGQACGISGPCFFRRLFSSVRGG